MNHEDVYMYFFRCCFIMDKGTIITVLLISVSYVSSRGPLKTMFPKEYPPMIKNGVDPGNPVYLTPLIEQGKFDEGKC